MAQTQRSSAGTFGLLARALALSALGVPAAARRRSRALLHEPPHVHAWGVGQVASHQTIELIVPILKDWHSVVGKKTKFCGHGMQGEH